MSNLATMIMEGSGVGFKANLKHSYDHENGACLIAMESAEALRDIFEAEFYVPNTCTIAAALEGASCVEESSQAAIMEASIKNAFDRIKKFFIDMKNKVIDFLNNIKRYLTGIFGNDEKWVKTYEKDLNALKSEDLKNYTVKMYDYSTIKTALDKAGMDKVASDLMALTKKNMKDYFNDSVNKLEEYDSSEIDSKFNEVYQQFLKDKLGIVDADEVPKAAWKQMRNGAESENDKNSVSVGKSEITKFIAAIKTSTKDISAYSSMITETDKAYKKCIDFVNSCEKEVNNTASVNGRRNLDNFKVGNDGGTSTEPGKNHVNATDKTANNYAAMLRKYSSTMSKMQSVENTINTAAKVALQERNKAYKKALVGAFGYARKHKGGK